MLRLIFIGLFVVAQLANGQDTVIDSLENKLQASEGESRLSILLELARETRRLDPMRSMQYADEVLEVLILSPNLNLEIEALYQKGWAQIYHRDYGAASQSIRALDSVARANSDQIGIGEAFLLKGRVARQKGKYDAGIAILDSGLVASEKTKDRILQLQLLNELGSIHRRKGNNKIALEYHREALAISKRINDKVSISTTLGYIGIIHDIMGHYDEALKAHQETLKLRRELNDKRGVGAALTNIGILHQKIANYDEANAFYNEALLIWKELDRELEQAATYNNLGAVQDLLGNDEEALRYYENALVIWKKYDDIHSVSIGLRNIGAIKGRQENYEEALDLHLQSLDIRQKLGDQYGSATSLIDIAELYQNLGQSSPALEAAQEGLSLAKMTGSWSVIRDAHQMLSELYEAIGNSDQALEHYKAFKAANDSLFNIESQSIVAQLQEEYKTQEQQQQIAALQQQEKIQTLHFWILAGGTVLIIALLILLYSRYHFKNEAHEALEKLHEKEIEKARLEKEKAEATAHFLHAENERKSQELEAARDLQLSMLPVDIPESPHAEISALMKTATEVGGDYYDFNLAEDGTLTVVIGDATGHGVKAGTMVTATKSLFNLLAGDKELTAILQQCSEAIKRMKLPKLYMALALLRLRGNELQLAGAGMPPALIYRAKTQMVEKIALKGMPLGSKAQYPYKQKTIHLERDDVVLLCTDGFPELFNEDGQMLGYDALSTLLTEVVEKPPGEIINHFRSTANRWLGDGMQNDDITFIALKSTVAREQPVEVQ